MAEANFRKRVKKLCVSMGLGEFSIGITFITDILAVSFIGVQQIAGHAFAELFIGLLYGVASTNQSLTYPEYAKTRDVSVVFSHSIISCVLTLILNVIILLGLPIILLMTDLSLEARSVVMPILICRSFGVYTYMCSTSLYTYMRTSGYDKQSSVGKILASSINIVLDIAAIAMQTGVVGVAIATTVAEVIELIYLNIILLKNGKRYKKSHFKYRKINGKNYLASLINVMMARLMNIVIGTILTKLGDTGYAIYTIVYNINDVICNFIYTYREVITITYSEFSDKVENFYIKIQKIFTKLTLIWWLISYPLTVIFVKLLTLNNNINISIFTIWILNLLMSLAEQLVESNIGLCRIRGKYVVITISSFIGSIAMAIAAHISVSYLSNPYLILCIVWTTFYMIVYCMTYRRLKTEGVVK